jgi:hypothetical protein
MSRRNVIALVGSVAFVLLAFWFVTLAFPRHQGSILGKWRSGEDPDCDHAIVYYVFTKDAFALQRGRDTPRLVARISAIETAGDAHRLRVYFEDKLPDLDAYTTYQVVGDTLTFGSVDWTPEARAKYPDEITAIESRLAAKGQTLSLVVRPNKPYYRCPD